MYRTYSSNVSTYRIPPLTCSVSYSQNSLESPFSSVFLAPSSTVSVEAKKWRNAPFSTNSSISNHIPTPPKA